MILCGQKFVDALMKHYRCTFSPIGPANVISGCFTLLNVGSVQGDFCFFFDFFPERFLSGFSTMAIL